MAQLNVDELFNEMYDETYSACRAYVVSRCPRLEDAPDVLQETYLALYRTLQNRSGKPIENPEAYVIRVAKSKLNKQYTLAERFRQRFLQPGETDETESSADPDPGWDPSEQTLADRVIDREAVAEVWQYLRSKPQEIQKIFYLFYYAEWTIPEIARAFRLTESTVKNRIYRTTGEIRRVWEKEGVDR